VSASEHGSHALASNESQKASKNHDPEFCWYCRVSVMQMLPQNSSEQQIHVNPSTLIGD